MRAAVLTGRETISVADVPAPVPAAGEVLVRTRYAGVCGSDLERVYGSTDDTYPAVPGAPGHEAVGTVVESRDPGFAPGDLVLVLPGPDRARAFAELQVLPAHSMLKADAEDHPLDLLLAQQLGTVVYALKHFWDQPGGRCAAVYGTGPAGLQFVQLLKRRGFETVVAVDLSPARLDLAMRMGADRAVLAGAADPVQVIAELTGGLGAELVVEAAGRDRTRLQAMLSCAPNGVVGLYGLPESREPASFPFYDLFRRRVTLTTCVGAQSEPNLASFRSAMRLIGDGATSTRGIVTHTYDLAHIALGLHVARTRADDAVKVCIRFEDAGP